FGTLDELFEALTLIQTGKVQHFPVVLVGSAYWEGMLDWLRRPVQAEGKVSPDDLGLFHLVDDPGEVVPYIRAVLEERPTEPGAEPHVRPEKGDAQRPAISRGCRPCPMGATRASRHHTRRPRRRCSV